MRKYLVIILTIALLSFLGTASGAEVIEDQYPFGAYSVTASITATHPSATAAISACGQSFIPMFDGGNLTNVQLYVYQASATGNITCSIRGHDGVFGSSGVPNSTTYATSTQVAVTSPFPTAVAVYNFSFPSGYVFDSTQKYFVTVEGVSGDVATVYVGLDNSAPYTHIGNYAQFANNVWTYSTVIDALFIIYADGGEAVTVSAAGDIIITEVTETTNVTANVTVLEVTAGNVTAGDVTATGTVTTGEVNVNATVTTGDVNVGGVTAEFNNTAVTAGDIAGGTYNMTLTGDVYGEGGGLPTTYIYTLFIFLFICLNLAVGYISKGFLLPATVGIVTVSISVAALFTTIYADILFSPWLQLMLLCLAIFNLFEIIRSRNRNE